ncbi:hypothetical protein ACOME3_009327 [Neoechinorhynchus agilis]
MPASFRPQTPIALSSIRPFVHCANPLASHIFLSKPLGIMCCNGGIRMCGAGDFNRRGFCQTVGRVGPSYIRLPTFTDEPVLVNDNRFEEISQILMNYVQNCVSTATKRKDFMLELRERCNKQFNRIRRTAKSVLTIFQRQSKQQIGNPEQTLP